MFDFNNVIEDNNSKETTDKVFLYMLDIRVLFFNKYKYLIEVKTPSEGKEFQKITNIIDNTYGNKNNKSPFIMEKQFHLLLEKYFKVIDTKQLYPEYKEYEPYFTNNSKKTEQIIYTDSIFMIEEISEGSRIIFSSDHDYSIKLASYNDKLIEQITCLSYPSNYNKIVRDITEECLSPLNYYNKLLEICEYVTLEGAVSYMLNYNLLKGAIQFYMDNNNHNKFYFNNVTNEIETSINKINNVDLLTIPYVTDPLIIETLFFNLYKIIIKIKKINGLYEIFLSSNNNGVLNHCNFKDNFYSFTKQYHFRYETGGYKEEIIVIWSDAYFKIIEVFDGRYFIMFNPNITIKDKEYLINLFNLTTFQENLKLVELKEQNILNYIKEYI